MVDVGEIQPLWFCNKWKYRGGKWDVKARVGWPMIGISMQYGKNNVGR